VNSQPKSPEEFWKDNQELESLALNIAKFMEQQEGRIKRLFSQLSTCTSNSDARMVLMFHIYRIKSRGGGKLADELEELLKNIPNRKDDFFKRYVLPKLRFLYNSIMYYYTRKRGT